MIELNIKHQIFTSSGNKLLEVNETIKQGSFIHVSGDSGIGKTTFLKILAGLIIPDFGFINVNNSIILDTSNRIFIPPQKRNISIMFQNYALFPNMNVRQNIAFAQNEKNAKKIDYYLDKFDLKQLEKIFPTKLSGGQQQRVALARTLVQQANIVLLDEPISAVDATMRQKLIDEIIKIHQENQSTFFVISHNEEEFENINLQKLIIK